MPFWTAARRRPARSPRPGARPSVEPLESRLVPYALSGSSWAHPQLITISFVPDGTILGTDGKGGYVTSNLHSVFDAKFGSASAWENVILRAAQTWAQQADVNFAVVADDGSETGSGPDQQGDPNKGDIRVGGYAFGNSTLAVTFMPPQLNNYSVAGDIDFNSGQCFNAGTTYDVYTVALHEMGHALGLDHSGSSSAIMYGSYNGTRYGLNADDINGVRAIYGARQPDAYDAAASNNTAATASDLTPTIDPTALTSVVNNLDITTTSDVDFYKVTLPDGSGGGFTVSAQSQGLSLLAPKLTVYAADRTTVLGTASVSGYRGGAATVSVGGAAEGQTYYVKVQGAVTTAFGTGAYALALDCGPNPMPAVTPPDTETANGNPLTGGGGAPLDPGNTLTDTVVNLVGGLGGTLGGLLTAVGHVLGNVGLQGDAYSVPPPAAPTYSATQLAPVTPGSVPDGGAALWGSGPVALPILTPVLPAVVPPSPAPGAPAPGAGAPTITANAADLVFALLNGQSSQPHHGPSANGGDALLSPFGI